MKSNRMKMSIAIFFIVIMMILGGSGAAFAGKAEADATATVEATGGSVGNVAADATGGNIGDIDNSPKASVSIDSHDKITSVDRNFINAGNVPMASAPNGFFVEPTPDASFRSVRNVMARLVGADKNVMYVSYGTLKDWASGGDVNVNYQVARGPERVKRAYASDVWNKDKMLAIALEQPLMTPDGKIKGIKAIPGFEAAAFVDGEADGGDTNSLHVLGEMGMKALKDDCNFMIVTQEGWHRAVEASGWGIGFYGVKGTISESGRDGGAGGGGTGYAENEVTTEDRPWIKATVGVKDIPWPKKDK